MADRIVHWEFVVLTFVGLLLPVLAPSKNRRIGRRLFWCGLILATVSAFFIAYPPDWQSGTWLALLCSVVMLITAYFNSPYLKVRGKIYAIGIDDSRPDPAPDGTPASSDGPNPAAGSYGGAITGQKFWWLLVFLTGIFAFNVIGYFVDGDNPRLAVVMAVALVAVPALAGFLDASEGYSIARGQRVQFAIVSIVTVGVFPLVYFLAYRGGTRWRLRRSRASRHLRH